MFITNYVWDQIGQRNMGEIDDSDVLNNIGIMWLSIIEDLAEMCQDITEDEWDRLAQKFEDRINDSILVNKFLDDVEAQAQKEMN